MEIRGQGAQRARDLVKRLERRAGAATDAGLPFLATVALVDGPYVAVKAANADTAGSERIAKLSGPAAVGDLGICIPLGGGSLVFARIAKAGESGYPQTVPIRAQNYTDARSTTSTTTPLLLIDTLIALPEGVWSLWVQATMLLRRDINSGYMGFLLDLGGTDSTLLVNSNAMTTFATYPHTATLQVTIPPGGGSVPLKVGFRGHSTAGTTYGYMPHVIGQATRVG